MRIGQTRKSKFLSEDGTIYTGCFLVQPNSKSASRMTSSLWRRDCNTQKYLETVDKQLNKTLLTCQKEFMRCLTRTTKRKVEDNTYMALIRKESILSTHPQSAMDLGTHTKTYSIRSCPLAPKQGPEQKKKQHYRKKPTQDFSSDSLQTSLFTISCAFLSPCRTASSTSSIPVPYPIPSTAMTASMQLRSSFCIDATCSQ